MPIGNWFRGGLREMFGDTLLSPRARARGLFEPASVRRLVDDHVTGRRDHTLRLWLLLVLELWQRQYADGTAAAHAA